MKHRSNTFTSLSGIGSRNPKNRIVPPVRTTQNLEIEIQQERDRAAINVSILIPAKRSKKGSRRVAALELSGLQIRKLFDTLSNFYNHRPTNA